MIEEKGTPDTSPDKEKVENVDEAKECLENLGEDHVEDGGWWGSWITAAKSKVI